MRFRALLRRLCKKNFGNRVHLFAAALKVEPSQLSRAMSKKNPQSFNVEGCLRLAKLTSTDAGLVLRAAKKQKIAALIEELYGNPRDIPSPEQQAVLKAWERIRDPKTREVLLDIIQSQGRTGDSGAGEGNVGGPGSGTLPPIARKDPPYKMLPVPAARWRIGSTR